MTGYLPLHCDTGGSQWEEGAKEKRKVTKGNKREPERGGEPRFHVFSRKAVHREEETGRRID